MPRYLSGNIDTYSVSPVTFVPCTGPLSAAQYRQVRFSIWVASKTQHWRAQPALRFGDDGNAWGTVSNFDAKTGQTYVTAEGWTNGDSWQDVSVTGGNTNTKQLVQFGVTTSNASGTALHSAVVNMAIDTKPILTGTLMLGPQRVHATSTTWKYFPLSKAIPADAMTEARATFEVLCTTDATNLLVQPYWEYSETPNNPSSWTRIADPSLATSRAATGFQYPSGNAQFKAIAQVGWIRFGARAQLSSGSSPMAATVALLIEYRAV